MKKLAAIFSFLLAFVFLSGVAFAGASLDTKVIMNGNEMRTNTLIVEGQTMIPIRDAFTEAGVRYGFLKQAQILVGAKGNNLILISTENNSGIIIYDVSYNQKLEEMLSGNSLEFEARLIKGRLYIPGRPLTSLLGGTIEYDKAKNVVMINVKNKESDKEISEKLYKSVGSQLQANILKSKAAVDISNAQMLGALIMRAYAEGKIENVSIVSKAEAKTMKANGVDLIKAYDLPQVPNIYGLTGKNRGWKISLTSDESSGSIKVEVLDDIYKQDDAVTLYPRPGSWDIEPYSLLYEGTQTEQDSEGKEVELSMEKTEKFTINTEKGDIEIVIYPELMPVTVENFNSLIEEGFYDDLTFHRVEDWVIQGGDPKGDGTGGSNKTIKLETNPKILNVRGAVAMARSSDPDSASSQFYILKKDAEWLDGQYAVFGMVVSGMDVVDKIESQDKIIGIKKVGNDKDSNNN